MDFKNIIICLTIAMIYFIELTLGALPANVDSLTHKYKDSDFFKLDSLPDMDIQQNQDYTMDESADWGSEKRGKKSRSRKRNFYYVSSDDLRDGEHEVRLQFSGVSAKQTSVGPTEGSPGGLVVQQISNGRQLLYMIYTGIASNVTATRAAGHADLDTAGSSGRDPDVPSRQFSLERQTSENPRFLQHLILKECLLEEDFDKVQEFMGIFRKESMETELLKEVPGATTTSLQSVQFRRVSAVAQLPEHLRSLIKFRAAKRQCRRHRKNTKKAQRFARRVQEREHKLQHNTDTGDVTGDVVSRQPHTRSRRSLATVLMVPHTKWCGVGTVANSYKHLGGNAWADNCCREHDHSCPYFITSWKTKYGLTNWSMKTYNHCNCDTRFRTCLKSSNTGASNLVGRVFFDMVRTECFTFVKKKTCFRRTWYGECLKYRVVRRAQLREPLPWTR